MLNFVPLFHGFRSLFKLMLIASSWYPSLLSPLVTSSRRRTNRDQLSTAQTVAEVALDVGGDVAADVATKGGDVVCADADLEVGATVIVDVGDDVKAAAAADANAGVTTMEAVSFESLSSNFDVASMLAYFVVASDSFEELEDCGRFRNIVERSIAGRVGAEDIRGFDL